MRTVTAYDVLILANAIWFGLAFHLFWLRRQVFAKILVPAPHRDTPVMAILAESGKFLGGFNGALSLLKITILVQPALFPAPLSQATLYAFFAVAHGSQFAGNVPIALQNRRGGGVWPVKGLMGFIFVTDFTLMIANAVAATLMAGPT
ncbi:MAG: hypothetical protein AAGJ86_02915 [Pseudomonadota bacterium]